MYKCLGCAHELSPEYLHDKVLAPNFPSITNVNAWHKQQARNLVLAGGRSDGDEVRWWNEIRKDGAKFEDFEDFFENLRTLVGCFRQI